MAVRSGNRTWYNLAGQSAHSRQVAGGVKYYCTTAVLSVIKSNCKSTLCNNVLVSFVDQKNEEHGNLSGCTAWKIHTLQVKKSQQTKKTWKKTAQARNRGLNDGNVEFYH